MKKYFYLTILSALVASCASDGIIEQLPENPNTPNGGSQVETDMPMGFVVSSKNMTRATMLQDVGIYNFGVFAYKSSETSYSVMDNYLVGYMNTEKKAGYYMTKENQTTLGDPNGSTSGVSMWAYEKMGNTEYDYTGGDGYYRKDDKRYISNNSKQYLKYWDNAADNTMFYAYTPYVNQDFTSTAVTFDNSTKTLDIPSGAIKDGYNNNTDYEFMYAATQVNKADYGKDVSLQFKHMTSKISIKFYEDLEGYDVRVINLSNSYGGIYAVPSIKSASGTYSRGTYYKSTGAKIVFNGTTATLTQVGAVAHDVTKASELLMFAAPEEQKIATTSVEATPSPTSYYGIPKSDATGGFTFHVSYELTSDTGERITVNNATAYVPANMCNWQPNSHYTYVFKITKNSNGTTEDNPTIDPTDPSVPSMAALLPIVFDNCTIEEWTEEEDSDVNVSDANTKYYSIDLDRGNVVKGSNENTVTASLKEKGADPTTTVAGKWSLSKPGETSGTELTDAKNNQSATVTVGSDWQVGKYVLTFTPDASMQAPNDAYEAEFYVIDAYKVSLNAAEVGTHGKSQSELTINTDEYALSANLLSIEYPAGLTGDEKAKVYIKEGKVVVKKEAVPGNYKIVYKIGDDVKTSAAFTVVDYNPDTNIPGNRVEKSQEDQTFTVSPATTSAMTYSLTAPEGADATKVTLSGNTITVKKDATVGQYILTLVVDNNGTKTTYERTFEVVNVYSLTLDRYIVDNDEATTVKVTAKVNGAEDTTTELEFTALGGVKLDGRTITVPKDATPSNYIVSYIVDGVVVARATLIVTD